MHEHLQLASLTWCILCVAPCQILNKLSYLATVMYMIFSVFNSILFKSSAFFHRLPLVIKLPNFGVNRNIKVIPNIFDTPLIITFSHFNNCLRSMGYLSFFNTLEPSFVPFFFFFLLLFWELHMSLFFQYSPILFVAYENFGEKDS